MKLSSSSPESRPPKISPQLSQWAVHAEPEERHSVIVRLAFSADPQESMQQVREAGAYVADVASTAIIASVTPRSLERVSKLDAVVAIEPPRVLKPLSGY